MTSIISIILVVISIFIQYSTCTTSSGNSSVDVDQWLNLLPYSSSTATSTSSSSHKSVTNSNKSPAIVQPKEENNSLDIPYNLHSKNERVDSTPTKQQILSLSPGWNKKGKRSSLLVRKKNFKKDIGQSLPAVRKRNKISEEARKRYAINRKKVLQRRKELGIKLTDSQKLKIKIRKQRQWLKVKSDAKLYAEFNEKRIARKNKRRNFVKANPELNEVRKRKNREHMQAYRERLKKEKNENE